MHHYTVGWGDSTLTSITRSAVCRGPWHAAQYAKEDVPYLRGHPFSNNEILNEDHLVNEKINSWVLDTTVLSSTFYTEARELSEITGSGSHRREHPTSRLTYSVLRFRTRSSLDLRGEDHISLMKEHFYQVYDPLLVNQDTKVQTL